MKNVPVEKNEFGRKVFAQIELEWALEKVAYDDIIMSGRNPGEYGMRTREEIAAEVIERMCNPKDSND